MSVCMHARDEKLTLMEHIAQWAVVQDHYLAQVRLDSTQILDEGAMTESAVLAVVAGGEELALRLQPVNDWVGVLLHRGREHNQIVPFAYLHPTFR